MKIQEIIHHLFGEADIKVNGHRDWDIIIHHPDFYQRLVSNADLAFGESYVDGWWDCARLDQLCSRIFTHRLDKKVLAFPPLWPAVLKQRLFKLLRYLFNYQTVQRAKTVGKMHYDVGNDLYQLMLDKRMTYTCGYWDKASNLEEAQEKKLDLTCQKLALKPGMTILDIGCGWGSFAEYAARYYGVAVTGVTISQKQMTLGRQRCRDLPVELRLQDYRELLKSSTQFDRIVSLGMFEHVGFKNYRTYMKVVEHCLKDNGLFLLHTIGSNKSLVSTSQWINTYIFPNGQIPSIAQIGKAIEGIFIMEDWHNFGVHYDKTLMAWHENFNQHWEQLKDKYGERFQRMWNFYLLSCAASFRTRQSQLWQIVLSKQSHGLPDGFNRSLDK